MENFSQNGAIGAIVYRAVIAFCVGGSIFGLIAPEAQSLAQVPQLDGGQKSRVLTFSERVAYQYAIEQVYWRHRIWPEENPGPKPSLDEVMSRAQFEIKVEDYLRKSQALKDYWQRPITTEQLQAEMDRMASHTKQPDALREIFAALSNDPFVIAECLARPILADRLATNSAVVAGVSSASFVVAGVPLAGNLFAADTAASTRKDGAPYTLPEIAPLDCTDDSWTATSTSNAPEIRLHQTAVWTGSEMIVWGGNNGGPLNTGGRYNPGADSWTATNTANAPSPRAVHTAVWTGGEMIVWGGNNGGPLNNGAKYNPGTDSWTAIAATNAPSGRWFQTAVWTGSEMIVWSGFDGISFFNTGGRYNPGIDSWTATTTTNAPAGREDHTAVWSGSEMIVWGGDLSDGSTDYLNTGAKYDPGTDSWTATSTTNAPSPRAFHTAVWSGGEMIVWGGYNPNIGSFNTGGRYNPGTDSWTATSIANAPEPRALHAAVWTGGEMIVWGGSAEGNPNTGGKYCAQSQAPTVTSAVSRKTHGGAGPFDINLPLTGTPGIECRAGGATSDYTIVATFSGNVTVTGSPQAEVTLGTGCVGTDDACSGNVIVSGNTVTIPLTNIANAQNINVRINGVNSTADTPMTDFTIPMSVLIGDTNGNGTVNAADVARTKAHLGQAIDPTNFRCDVNANGSINAADTAIVKQNSGISLPP